MQPWVEVGRAVLVTLAVEGVVQSRASGRREVSLDPRPPGSDKQPFALPGVAAPAPGDESTVTVIVALIANVLVAIAKSVAALMTGSASLVAESAHSWADSGNEVFLVIANRRAGRPPDASHPYGYGREAYVWSLFAALGLFVAGAAVSVTHGVQQLVGSHPPEGHLTVGYVVLAVAFCLEGISFVRSITQARPEALSLQRDLLEHVLRTSDPTLRAVFAEDAAALVGLLIAAGGLLVHQITGSPVPDAVGSILVGVLLGVVALVLIDQNRRYLVGQQPADEVHREVIRALLASPEVDRVTYLRLEFVGPRVLFVTGDVDLAGDETESGVAPRLRALEARLAASRAVAGAVLSLSAPDEPSLTA